jgi:pimeloyl-ACP methyl ester carboxylesterase
MTETRYARADTRPVAYQIAGDGPRTLVCSWGLFSSVDEFPSIPGYAEFIARLSEFARVVTFDMSGTGASDRSSIPTFDERLDDLVSVVDDVGADRVTLFGAAGSGALAVRFATTFPERTDGIVLYGSFPRFMANDELPFMASPDLLDVVRAVAKEWGSGFTSGVLAPSIAVTEEGRNLWRYIERSSVEPDRAVEIVDVDATIDVVDLLDAVNVPTLVMHRVNEQFVPPQAATYLASKIPHAQLVLLDGLDHLPWLGNSDRVADAIRRFMAGEHQPTESLNAVLITDIVSSTELLIGLGEARWNELLERHDEIVGAEVADVRGKLVKLTGDGMLGVFDHPADALRCATRLRDGLRDIGLEIRVGATVGDVVFRRNDVTGLSVHIAERITKLAQPGQILVSRGVTVLLSESHFNWIGLRSFRGVPVDRSVYELR